MNGSTPSHRIHAVTLVVATALIVAIIGLLAAFITWRYHTKQKEPCIANCPPPVADTGLARAGAQPLTESNIYRSSALGYSIEYGSPPWSKSDDSSDTVVLDGFNGNLLFKIQGARTSTPPAVLVTEVAQDVASRLNVPDLQVDRPIRGAKIGHVPAVGSVYSGTFVPSSGGQAVQLRIPVLAATSNGLALVAFALAPWDSSSKGGVAGAGAIDYLLTESHWPGD